MPEAVNFQVNNDVTFQYAMIENEIGLVIILIYKNAFLAIFKAKTAAPLQQESLQIVQYGRF